MFDGEKNSFRNAVNKKESDNGPTRVAHMEFRVKSAWDKPNLVLEKRNVVLLLASANHWLRGFYFPEGLLSFVHISIWDFSNHFLAFNVASRIDLVSFRHL